ncbi:group 3 mite allergen-like protein [Dermatophagoides farinae]|uniref:Acrosin n=1 Tax=Dermatophagoides farinae TaxID=6954 RepID=A0A9D4SG08_DERFA|nr:group 3 mite allergen-like protein [Dermatophagoides farinae]
MTSNNQTTKGPNINSKQKLPKLNKFAKAQKWFSRLNFAYELSKSIRNDFRNYKEINEEILRIEETINELENIDDNENDDEQELRTTIIHNLQQRLQDLIAQRTRFPIETARSFVKYSGAVLAETGVTLAAGILMSNPPDNDDARIIGGEDVQPNQYPWMVYMKLNYLPLHEWQKPMTSSCDGSIINDRWIISAAHCFAPNGYNLSENIVYLGSHNITKTEEKNRKIIKAKKAIIHEKYDKWNIKNDIALVELSEIIEFNEYISPICMANSYEEFDHDNCQTLGWGRTGEHMEKSSTLKKVVQKLRTLDDCKKFYSDLDDTQLCAGTLNHGPCTGDSGGPLQCLNQNQSSSSWFIKGIVSYGSPHYTEKPAVYTKVSAYIEWINKTIENNHHCE